MTLLENLADTYSKGKTLKDKGIYTLFNSGIIGFIIEVGCYIAASFATSG